MPRSATFLLLHGTFARGARWTAPGSPLRQRIEAESRAAGITNNIRAVSWSGRNRTRDRFAAGRELAKILSGIDEIPKCSRERLQKPRNKPLLLLDWTLPCLAPYLVRAFRTVWSAFR